MHANTHNDYVESGLLGIRAALKLVLGMLNTPKRKHKLTNETQQHGHWQNPTRKNTHT